MPLLTTVAYASTYIILIFDMTRYRATVHPIILLWVGMGMRSVAAWVIPMIRDGLAAVPSESWLLHGTAPELDVDSIVI